MPLSHFVVEAKRHTPVQIVKTDSVAAPILGDEPEEPIERNDLKKAMAEISESEKVVAEVKQAAPEWMQCKHLKSANGSHLCTQYVSLCAQDKCQRKFMETSFFDFKRYLKQGKCIK